MAKEKEASMGGFWREMFQMSVYKRTQGRIARQLTFAAIVLLVVVGAWRLSFVFGTTPWTRYELPLILAAAGVWLGFRIVNMTQFADFLIAVEAEMGKVSWPTRKELIRSSVVVMITIFALAIVLTSYDLFWRWLLSWFGVIAG